MSDTANEIEQTVETQPTSQTETGSMTDAVNNDTGVTAETDSNDSQGSMTDALKNSAEPQPIEYSFTDKDGNTAEENDYSSAVKDMSKNLGLTQEQAQKFFDQAQGKVAEINQQALNKAKEEWIQQTLADNEIGGQYLNETRTHALHAINAFGSEQFKAVLIGSGMIEHPEVIRFLSRVGKATGEDRNFINGSKAQAPKKSFLREIYGTNSPELFED